MEAEIPIQIDAVTRLKEAAQRCVLPRAVLPPQPVLGVGELVAVRVGHRQDVKVEKVHQVRVFPVILHELFQDERDARGADPLSSVNPCKLINNVKKKISHLLPAPPRSS